MMDTIKVKDLIPYKNNPRIIDDDAVDKVAESIKEFGFKVPVIIDKDNVIVAGHTRRLAALKLGIEEVPYIKADDLTDEQIKMFRLADNKVAEYSTWDFSKLEAELAEFETADFDVFGFESEPETDLSYIEELLNDEEEELGKIEPTSFSITFVFDNKYKESINAFLSENGKEPIVNMIVGLCENEV